MVQQIRSAIERAEAPQLRTAAHALKGALAVLGAPAAHAAAEHLELLGRSGDLSPAPAALAILEGAIARLEAVLTAMLCTARV
jgi:HPt (histidine-containing phosphotransfer) domain-containing protein